MTLLRQEALSMVEAVPEERLVAIVEFMRGFQGEMAQPPAREDAGSATLFPPEGETSLDRSRRAFAMLQKYRRKGTADIDCKQELAEILEARHESLG